MTARPVGAGGTSHQLETAGRACRIGGLLVIGLLLGACSQSSPRSSASGSAPAPMAPTTPTTPTTSATSVTSVTSGTGALSRCLVGTWIDRGESDTLSYEGTSVAMVGLAGTTVTFSPNGAETVKFAGAVPLRGSVDGSTYAVTERGTISALASSSAGIVSFADVNYTDFSETATLGAATVSPPEPAPPTPDHYTCSATTMSLSGDGAHATFTRSVT